MTPEERCSASARDSLLLVLVSDRLLTATRFTKALKTETGKQECSRQGCKGLRMIICFRRSLCKRTSKMWGWRTSWPVVLGDILGTG